MQDFHGRCGNLVNLLSDSTDRNNSFSGNWRIIKTNDLVVIWKLSILLNQMIEHDVGKCIIWKKNSLCFALIFRINCFQQIFENQRTFFITVAGICENQFMWNLIFFTDIRKAFLYVHRMEPVEIIQHWYGSEYLLRSLQGDWLPAPHPYSYPYWHCSQTDLHARSLQLGDCRRRALWKNGMA